MREYNVSLNSIMNESGKLAESGSNLTDLSAANVTSYFYELTKLGKIIE